MNFNEILTNPLYELGSPWQCVAGGSALPLLSGCADKVWGEVSLGPGLAQGVPVGAEREPPAASKMLLLGQRRAIPALPASKGSGWPSPDPGFTARAQSFCTGFLRLPLRSCAPEPDSQPAP